MKTIVHVLSLVVIFSCTKPSTTPETVGLPCEKSKASELKFLNDIITSLQPNETAKYPCTNEIYQVEYLNQTYYVVKLSTSCANPRVNYYTCDGMIKYMSTCGVVGCTSNVPAELEFSVNKKIVIYKFPKN